MGLVISLLTRAGPFRTQNSISSDSSSSITFCDEDGQGLLSQGRAEEGSLDEPRRQDTVGLHQHQRPREVEEHTSKCRSGYKFAHSKASPNLYLFLHTAIAGLNRCGKSCRLRWLNYLRPDIKRGNITEEEEELIVRLHNLLGNR